MDRGKLTPWLAACFFALGLCASCSDGSSHEKLEADETDAEYERLVVKEDTVICILSPDGWGRDFEIRWYYAGENGEIVPTIKRENARRRHVAPVFRTHADGEITVFVQKGLYDRRSDWDAIVVEVWQWQHTEDDLDGWYTNYMGETIKLDPFPVAKDYLGSPAPFEKPATSGG